MLGDLDIGLHLVRTQALREGEPLSAVTARLDERRGPRDAAPAGDRRPAAHALVTPAGHVRVPGVVRRPPPRGRGRRARLRGRRQRRPAPGVLEAIAAADAIVIAPSNPFVSSTHSYSSLSPSNPFVSIHPILAVPGIRAALEARSVASSPSAR